MLGVPIWVDAGSRRFVSGGRGTTAVTMGASGGAGIGTRGGRGGWPLACAGSALGRSVSVAWGPRPASPEPTATDAVSVDHVGRLLGSSHSPQNRHFAAAS